MHSVFGAPHTPTDVTQRNQMTRQTRRSKAQRRQSSRLPNLHHPEGQRNSKCKTPAKKFPTADDCRHPPKPGRIPIRNGVRPQYGILHNPTYPLCTRCVHHTHTLGQIFVSATPHGGISRQRYFPTKNHDAHVRSRRFRQNLSRRSPHHPTQHL